MLKDNCRVLVSGASVAGQTVAYWLARYGFSVTIVEKAPHVRPGGQALDVRGPGVEVAKRMGILQALKDRGTKQTGMSVVDFEGKEIYRSTTRNLTGGQFDSPDVEILRDDLCAILQQIRNESTEYIFNDSIVSLTQDNEGVDVVFKNSAPRRFDLVIGADGLHSGVRKIAFGPEQQFTEYLGRYIAVFPMPNYMGLEHWQVFYQHGQLFAGAMGFNKEDELKTYIIFESKELLKYNYDDMDAQKQLVVDHVADAGWDVPKFLEYMWQSPVFHFDGIMQIRMDSWSSGRVVLVGDAAYSITPVTGQGTTVAMVGAYTLAGELAAHRDNLLKGIESYESELRVYIERNQALAMETNFQLASAENNDPEKGDGMTDFGALVQPFTLKDYV